MKKFEPATSGGLPWIRKPIFWAGTARLKHRPLTAVESATPNTEAHVDREACVKNQLVIARCLTGVHNIMFLSGVWRMVPRPYNSMGAHRNIQ